MRLRIGFKLLFLFLFFYSPFAKAQQVYFEYDTVCENMSSRLKAITDIIESDIVSYKWDFGNDGTFDATGKETVYTKQINNTVKLLVTTTTGSLSFIKQVVFHKLPLSLFALPNSCESESFLYDDYSFSPDGAISKYDWDFNNDGVIDSRVAGDVSFVFGSHGVYTSTLRVETVFGCSSIYSSNVIVYDKPKADFNIMNHCIGDNTVFSNLSTYYADSVKIMTWDFGDSNGINSTSNKVTHQYSSIESFPVSLEIEYFNGCKDKSIKSMVTNPKLEFELKFSPDTIIYKGRPVSVELTHVYDSIFWSTGETQQNIQISEPGLYGVRVVDSDCIHSENFNIVEKDIIPVFEFESSVLTLNGDGINDRLVIKNFGAYGNCNFSVYNSRGVLIFSRKIYQNDWDMIVDGHLLESGGYFYIAETESGIFRGSFSVLR